MTPQCPDQKCRTIGVHYHRTGPNLNEVHSCGCNNTTTGAHVDGIVWKEITASLCYLPRPDADTLTTQNRQSDVSPTANLCLRGHDKNEVGTSAGGRCSECQRHRRIIRNAKRKQLAGNVR